MVEKKSLKNARPGKKLPKRSVEKGKRKSNHEESEAGAEPSAVRGS